MLSKVFHVLNLQHQRYLMTPFLPGDFTFRASGYSSQKFVTKILHKNSSQKFVAKVTQRIHPWGKSPPFLVGQNWFLEAPLVHKLKNSVVNQTISSRKTAITHKSKVGKLFFQKKFQPQNRPPSISVSLKKTWLKILFFGFFHLRNGILLP